MIGTTELIVIALVIFVLFGSAAIPRFARSLGQAKAEFEKGQKQQEVEETEDAKSAKKPRKTAAKKTGKTSRT
jgi:sec-independent protein translocase protein TatA